MKAWKTIRAGVDVKGAAIEMRYAEFGKGKAKLCKWEIFREGVYIDYAVNELDAGQNWALALTASDRNGRGDLIN